MYLNSVQLKRDGEHNLVTLCPVQAHHLDEQRSILDVDSIAQTPSVLSKYGIAALFWCIGRYRPRPDLRAARRELSSTRGEGDGNLATPGISPHSACQECFSFFCSSLRQTETAWKPDREMSIHPMGELGG
jgi:hypothetical protein